ncbi:hypothetical protein AAFF_G00265410 [Aldrovandia affinis]|uniref:Uncharacterized protein n=1 Tax=Aldrovandia affinis TaxID=143900 RepID=A0AAD7W326_9TELE|nr:hypothetical protein AAFF_G00265410 [Aldrovandia affinis]
MSNRVLHKQLTSIMEVLANTAVAEICKVVDDGYAVLRLEVSQGKKENEALRRKLQRMELRVASGCPETARARATGPLCSEFKATTTTTGQGYFPPGPQMDISTGRESKALDEEDTSVHPVTMGDQCAGVEEGKTESLLIKEERLEEDPHGEMKIEEEKTDSESLSFHSELQPGSATGSVTGNGLCLGSIGAKPQAVMTGSTLIVEDEEGEVHTVWNKDTSSNRGFTQYRCLNLDETAKAQPCAGVEEGRTESLLIKDERRKENLAAREPQGELRNTEERRSLLREPDTAFGRSVDRSLSSKLRQRARASRRSNTEELNAGRED